MSLADTLKEIRDIFKVDQATTGEAYLSNPWFMVASVTLASINRHEGVIAVYQLVSQDIDALTNSDDKAELLAKVILKQRDAILKGLVVYGVPKAITTLFTLDRVLPDDIRSRLPQQPVRPESQPDQKQHAQAYFNQIYGEKAKVTYDTMYEIYPDLGAAIESYFYPSLLSFTSITDAKETSLIMVATLFSQQVMPILKGHQQGARLNGLTENELDQVYAAVRALARLYNLGELESHVPETYI